METTLKLTQAQIAVLRAMNRWVVNNVAAEDIAAILEAALPEQPQGVQHAVWMDLGEAIEWDDDAAY